MREIKASLHYLTKCILAYDCNFVASWVFQIAAQCVNKKYSVILFHNI